MIICHENMLLIKMMKKSYKHSQFVVVANTSPVDPVHDIDSITSKIWGM